MRPVFQSDDVKGSFFLATLPDTMDNVIDNLSTRNITAFADIEPKILDISEKHSLDSVDSSTAYAARQSTVRDNRRGRLASVYQPQGCTWCQKHNLTFVGHVYTNCNELRKHKEKQQKGKAPSKEPQRSGKRQKANNASAQSINDTDDSVTDFTAFNVFVDLTTPPTSPEQAATLSQNGKRSREEVSAHVAIKRPTVSDPLRTVRRPLSVEERLICPLGKAHK